MSSRIKLALRRMAQEVVGYCTLVDWDGMRVIHYSWTFEDAMEWRDQYPIEARRAIFKRGKNCEEEVFAATVKRYNRLVAKL